LALPKGTEDVADDAILGLGGVGRHAALNLRGNRRKDHYTSVASCLKWPRLLRREVVERAEQR
jgi:hypothetical protein